MRDLKAEEIEHVYGATGGGKRGKPRKKGSNSGRRGSNSNRRRKRNNGRRRGGDT